ncbi:aconitate hydratase [Bradyrhizobium arachidis]|nr:aconitate hydratase [Bradyrhizobium arachidis]
MGFVPASVSAEIKRLRGDAPVSVPIESERPEDGAILIAAITSCTTTANPQLMAGAGLLARNARQRGLTVPWWVKTSLSPGSRPTAGYLADSGLQADLDALGFHVTGFGCMTCIGNSGELDDRVNACVKEYGLLGAAVLSGNRNFEGRVHPSVKLAYLASPALVVAYALAGTVRRNLEREPITVGRNDTPVFLADIWPTQQQIDDALAPVIGPKLFARADSDNHEGRILWDTVSTGVSSSLFAWSGKSTYLRRPPYLDGMKMDKPAAENIYGARVFLVVGDRVTTDHISPAGSISEDSVAGQYLRAHGVRRADFNQFNTRRGNHEVMIRGGFSNPGLVNELLAPQGIKGGYVRIQPEGEVLPVFDAAMRYDKRHVPLVVVAGKEYGAGSSRDWAAKATALLGIRSVIAENFERIHRNNLISMGIWPLEFTSGLTRRDLALDGSEELDILGLDCELKPTAGVTLVVRRGDGSSQAFQLIVKVDTQAALQSLRHGGVLPQTLRELEETTRRAGQSRMRSV